MFCVFLIKKHFKGCVLFFSPKTQLSIISLFSGAVTLFGASSMLGIVSAGSLLGSLGASPFLTTILAGVSSGLGAIGLFAVTIIGDLSMGALRKKQEECRKETTYYEKLANWQLSLSSEEGYKNLSLSQRVEIWALSA